MFQRHELDTLAESVEVPDAIARHVVQKLGDQYLLRTEGGWTYIADVRLAMNYEEAYERQEFWHHNELRREELRRAARAFEDGMRSCSYQEAKNQFVEAPWVEAVAAAKTLEEWGFVEVREFMVTAST